MFDLDSVHTELLFNAHIDEFHVVDKDMLFGELSKGNFTDFHRTRASVYFLAKTRRVKFLPETFVVESGFCLSGKVRIGSRVETVRFNVAKILFEASGVKEGFTSWEHWATEVMSGWDVSGASNLPVDEIYRRFSSIDFELSSGAYLYIDCKLLQGAKGGELKARTVVNPVQLAHMFDWDVFDDIEVLYIGKSKGSVLNRTLNHNKWGAITSAVREDEMVLVYFLNISHSPIAKMVPHQMLRVVGSMTDDELDRDAVSVITEAALIKHFFKEKGFNEKIVNQPIEEVAMVKEILVDRGYTGVLVAVQLEGPLGVLGTDFTGHHNHHVARYTLQQL
ncbi:hypothetical protein [Paraburkholderia unamae]|uniref:Uncharacterized protein n=1 Tax=Paraburkholderia unamae TaxID=219649 RepID=A0ABX5KPX1_9BURK|nr:hypothetical protein [Paraburkholderia unamae]PVX82455.1 hypothetical protein C7402_109309 [Paraburkholderia unamae]